MAELLGWARVLGSLAGESSILMVSLKPDLWGLLMRMLLENSRWLFRICSSILLSFSRIWESSSRLGNSEDRIFRNKFRGPLLKLIAFSQGWAGWEKSKGE